MVDNGQMTAVPPSQYPASLQQQTGQPAAVKVTKEQAMELVGNPPTPPNPLALQQAPAPTGDAQKAVLDTAGSHLRRMLYFRRNYDAPRSGFYRQYIGQRDAQLFPDGKTKRSNTFVPYPYSNVETIVSRTLDALFSTMPWFDCKGRGANDEPVAEKMTQVLAQRLHKANAVKHLEDLIRNICIYGHAAIKVDWDWDFDICTYAEPILAMMIDPSTGQPTPIPDPNTGQPIVAGYRPAQKLVPRARPKLMAIDIYDLLIDPDGGFVAHLQEKTWGQIQRESQTNPSLYYPEALTQISMRLAAEKDPSSVIIRLAELWNEVDNTCTLVTFGEDSEAIRWKDLRYTMRSLGSYTGFRRKVYAGPMQLLWHGSNPFMHKRAPILHTSYSKLPNEIYGMGAVEVISDLTESLNRLVNMVTDNWNLGINKRYAYDTNADIDHEALNNFNVPGGKVAVNGDPNKVILPLPVATPAAGDYALMETYKGMIEITSGISDFYSKGMGSPTGNGTATGISQIISESNFRFKMFIRNLELDVLQPLLEMCAANIQQYITDPIEVEITDAPPGIPKWYMVHPEELLGALSFDLTAANYAANKTLRQRNLLAFAAQVQESPYIDQYQAIIELGKVFEIRNIKNVLKTPEQVAMEQAAAKKEQIQMMIFEAMLNTESAARISQSKPKPAGAGQGAGGGQPRRATQPEGKLPGAGLTSDIRDMAQSMGLNAAGLAGMGETGNG
jgi:hypothetical protein